MWRLHYPLKGHRLNNRSSGKLHRDLANRLPNPPCCRNGIEKTLPLRSKRHSSALSHFSHNGDIGRNISRHSDQDLRLVGLTPQASCYFRLNLMRLLTGRRHIARKRNIDCSICCHHLLGKCRCTGSCHPDSRINRGGTKKRSRRSLPDRNLQRVACAYNISTSSRIAHNLGKTKLSIQLKGTTREGIANIHKTDTRSISLRRLSDLSQPRTGR